MTTAQDQQSRADFEKAWADRPVYMGSDHQKDLAFTWWFQSARRAQAEQAARALPAPENVREGEPYDDPAFEDLARTMVVWGTAQSALCAQFFLAGQAARALPAGTKPVAEIYAGQLLWVSQGPDAEPVAGDHDLYTAAQVLAMGRVPPCPYPCGWDGLHKIAVTDGAYLARTEWPEDEEGVSVKRATVMRNIGYLIDVCRTMLAAALRPPAAQERKPLTDERIRQIDDETHFHESPGWPLRFARAIEAELRKKAAS